MQLINQNTSKRCGEWGIKLTKKTRQRLIVLLVIMISFVALLFFIGNFTPVGEYIGRAVDAFFISKNTENSGHDFYYEFSRVNWVNFKKFIYFLGAIFIVLLAFFSYLISQYLLKRERQDITKMIANSLGDEETKFHEEYVDVYNQLEMLKLTNLKNEELLIQETQRTKDLVTYLAHDLRTPLASVIGYLNLLVDTNDSTEEIRMKYLNITLDKAYRLEYLIDDFFDITRFNFHKIVLDYSTFNMNLLFYQMVEEFYPILDKKAQQITLNLPETLMIEGDSPKLARVFNNLLKNASSYGFDHSEISVEAFCSEETVKIIISNRGNTIPPEKLTSIFDKFYRLDNSRSTASGGSGLGLAIAKEIVTAHDGTISASSQQNVTQFIVELPLGRPKVDEIEM